LLEQTLGFKTLGNGPETVFIIHDWFSDHTAFDGLQPYLNTALYKYIFVDLRGYGLSKTIYGSCTIEEASQDILAIANKLKIERFQLVGHAMGGQIVQYLPVTSPNRIKSIVAVCPVPACGNPVPDDVMHHLEAITKGDITNAKLLVQYMTQNRYHDWFYERKALNWFSCSSPQARAAYLKMFCETDVSNLVSGIEIPMLLICGDFDAAAHSSQRMQQTVMHYFKNAQLVNLPSGHYPMEETPVLLATTMENFWQDFRSFV
jgi:pimeloyl-ACP methyl ester carboxylesterase